MNYERPYTIKRISDRFAIVWSMTYESPLGFIKPLEEDLSAMDFAGVVLFDLLLCNGNVHNRFASATFESGKMNLPSMKVVDRDTVNSSILAESKDFYSSNQYLFEHDYILLEEDKRELICS